MAIFKPSNLSPNMTEIDVTQSFKIKFEVHTAGSNVSAYELKIYKEFNVEDDEDGEKSIVYQQAGNFTDPDTYTNGDEVTITVPSDNGLKNEENYRWSIRVYQDTIPSDPSAADYAANLLAITSNSIVPTYVGEDMIVGSTRDVIWSPDYNYNMKINNCVECRFNSFNSDFNIFEKDPVTKVRPQYLTYTTESLEDFGQSDIYGTGFRSVRCLQINTSKIDKKKFDQLTDKQYYLLISTDSSFSSSPITVQIQDIIKDGNNFYIVPYNQDFIRSTSSSANDRYAPFYQTIPSPSAGQTYSYSIECRQRSTITDMYKNVGEQNLTELLFETPFEYSYKGNDYIDQNAGIYSSLGLQDELIEDSNETKERNIILKTIYIKPNLRGDGVLHPTNTTDTSHDISGGWILSGSEDASYGSLHSLYPINCFIKFGNFETVSTLPTAASDYKGKIILPTGSSDFYISLPTSSSAYGWVKYDQCTYNQIVGSSTQAPGFFNVQAYNLTDGQLVIKVPETFYVNTDQFYTLYYVSNPVATETTDYAYFLDSGVIGGGKWDFEQGGRITNNPFSVKGYNVNTTVSSGECYYYDLFLAPNNSLKPDRYRPVYAEIENDDTRIEGLIINSGTYDKDISVDKLDKTQYLCQFMTTVTPSSDAIKKYDIFQPQTKVKIYTQFIDSVPQQYFYARKPLLYDLGVLNISDNDPATESGIIEKRDVRFKATRDPNNSTSNQIKYYRYQIYAASDNQLLYDSENIYNDSMEYIVRGLPNKLTIQVKLIYEDNLGHLTTTAYNFPINYQDLVQEDQVSLESNCSLHANQIGFSAIPGELFASTWSSASHNGDIIEIEQGGTVEYKKLNEESDIEIHDGSTILTRMQFGYDLVNPSNLVSEGFEMYPFIYLKTDADKEYQVAMIRNPIEASVSVDEGLVTTIFTINSNYRKLDAYGAFPSGDYIEFSSGDLTTLSGFTFMFSDSSVSVPERIPMITAETAQLSGDVTCPTICITESSFVIPSSDQWDNLYIVDPAQAFHETKLSQNTYDVLITTGTQPSCTITKVSM